jgi:hypothetical protein
MTIKSETVFISLAALLAFGLMSQNLRAEAQSTPTNSQPATISGGWNATLLDRNSPLMQGADLGQPKEIFAHLHDVWGTDPIAQAAQRLTLNNRPSSVWPTNPMPGSFNRAAGSAAYIGQGRANVNAQWFFPPVGGTPDLSTPEGRFAYYRPIFERRAQQLNEEQRRQQLQFPVYRQN